MDNFDVAEAGVVTARMNSARLDVEGIDASIAALTTRRARQITIGCEMWEWLLENTPQPDLSTNKPALRSMVRDIVFYNSSVGFQAVAEWVSSFGDEFTLVGFEPKSGLLTNLPQVRILVPVGAKLDDLATRVLALTKAIEPAFYPVSFEIGSTKHSDGQGSNYLFGPDEGCPQWSLCSGEDEMSATADATGSLRGMLSFATGY